MNPLLPIIPNDGITAYSDIIITNVLQGANNCFIHLFSNNYVPDKNTVKGSFTEFSAGGYGPIILGVPANLGIDSTRRDVWVFPETVWTATGPGIPQIAYGYWIDLLDPISLTVRVIQAQRFQAPQVWLAVGNKIRFTVSMGLAQC